MPSRETIEALRRGRELLDEALERNRSEFRDIARQSTIRRLRLIPAGDQEKKAELAAFFQSEQGRGFSRAERKQSYDDLLGADRNRRTIG